ncbi:MAG TPA: hypothetical protein VKO45_08415 [Methanomicrobiales archaeon]|nr:hypothetical protein [Methanomicrobiales archaeon]
MARKILTIGITINLENYENLRLEVQGEIGSDGNTEELISFLDGMLARLGHGDQVTAERVEAYRRRVLAMPGSAVIAAVPDWKADGTEVPGPRPAPVVIQAERVITPREPQPPEIPQEAPPPGEAPAAPATVRVVSGGRGAKPISQAPARPEEIPPPVPASQPQKGVSKWTPKEAPKEPVRPEKPPLAEGEVACEGCGLAITRNQEKLSRLLTGKSLCKKCMNPP